MLSVHKLILLITCAWFMSCAEDKASAKKEASTQSEDNTKEELPFIGYMDIDVDTGDTLHHQIQPFGGLINQHGDTIDYSIIDNQIYLADFFFTSCGGQCPKMTAALKRVQQNCADLDFMILSHTIDPRRDSAETFQRYIKRSGIDDHNWQFLTGKKSYLRELGENSYIAVAGFEDSTATENDNHSNLLFLIDKKRHIRGYYVGTDPKEVDQLMIDLRTLSESYD